MLELSPYIQKCLGSEDPFSRLMQTAGQVYREVKNRKTQAIVIGERHFFLKTHRGCGWREILKNLLTGSWPVTGASTEWKAIERMEHIGISTLKIAGKGQRGWNPARRESFLLTEAMHDVISLEDLTRDWMGLEGKQKTQLKYHLIHQVADITRRLHQAGLNHRDYYLCHFLVRDRNWRLWDLQESIEVFLIDLHRMQERRKVPTRWRIKDLGGLLFSALDCPLTDRDLLRFLRIYRKERWRESLLRNWRLWNRVLRKAHSLYRGFHGRSPTSPKAILRLHP